MGFFSNVFTASSQRQQPLKTFISNDGNMDEDKGTKRRAVLSLPPEIIQQVLSYLEVQDLVAIRQACRDFKAHAELEQHWIDLIRPNVQGHDFPSTPAPASSFRELYLSHHPRWHLPRHKIWFSDDAYNGKFIVIKFDPRRGSIEGYRLTAEKPPAIPQIWTYKPSVIIHHIDPRVYASTEDPIISMPLSTFGSGTPGPLRRFASTPVPATEGNEVPYRPAIPNETRMRVGHPHHPINASLLLSKDLPAESANDCHVSVWPPRTIPDMPRTRSGDSTFQSKGHMPQTLDVMSETTFRLRTWSHFTQGMLSLGVRIGEEVSTWSTLLPHLYTPTPSKPYQGIFVGDYASHGCEFLLVMHTDRAPRHRRDTLDMDEGTTGENNDNDNSGNLRRRNYISTVLAALREQQFIDEEDELTFTDPAAARKHSTAHSTPAQRATVPNVPDPDGVIHRGALEAVKLTGDVNVPRGEHTFIADDIGEEGLIRIAWEEPFKGARVVRSRGHVAARGFRDDEFIPSQLFLISPDLLAQYWLPFGHISFYKRIDVDELLAGATRGRRDSAPATRETMDSA